jgi:hypothetical protein
LPSEPFAYAEWKTAKVHPDYHVEVDKTFYSVPHRLIGRRVEVRLTYRAVEIFQDHTRVASHVRRSQRSGHVTVNEHMPKAHQRYANMTPASLISMAGRIGVNAATLVERIMRERPHPEQGYRSAMGIIAHRLCAACCNKWKPRSVFSASYYVYPDAAGYSPALSDVYSISVLPPTGTLSEGNSITFVLEMDEAWEVVGHPTLSLNSGGIAHYAEGSASSLRFTYTVGKGQAAPQLAITAVDLNGGVIRECLATRRT